MFLLIDSSKKHIHSVALFDESGQKILGRSTKSLAFLQTIDSAISASSLNTKDVQGVAVVFGEGTFTASRVAATIANVFAFNLNIPVVHIREEHTIDLKNVGKMLMRKKRNTYISAAYSSEPNIGGSH